MIVAFEVADGPWLNYTLNIVAKNFLTFQKSMEIFVIFCNENCCSHFKCKSNQGVVVLRGKGRIYENKKSRSHM